MNRPSGGPSNGCFLKTFQKVHGFPATSPKLSSAALLLDFLFQSLIISISFLINPIFINTKPWYQLTTYLPTSRIWCPICILACVSWALRLVRMAQRRKHELFRDGPRRVDRNETSRPVGWTTIICPFAVCRFAVLPFTNLKKPSNPYFWGVPLLPSTLWRNLRSFSFANDLPHIGCKKWLAK